MPCNSDYMAASGQELESKRVCECIVYLHRSIGRNVPKWIQLAADDYYGNVGRIDEATKILCESCRGLDTCQANVYIYDGRNSKARKLADWFDRHQEWDERRVAEEDEMRAKIMLKERALKKLTTEEMEALDLNS